jgi:hypothetical protein
MLLLAVAAVDKVKTLPPETWLKIGIAALCVIIGVFVIRKIMNTNKLIAGVLVFTVTTIVFFSWVYNRNEPAFLTPVVEQIAPFFPSGRNIPPPKAAPKPTPERKP